MAITYTPIATNTLTSAANSVTFSSISGTYTDLIVVCNSTISNNGGGAYMAFNGDTSGTNYSQTFLYGTGAAAGSTRTTNSVGTSNWVGGQIGGMSNTTPSTYVINVMNYSNTTTYKTILSRSSSLYTEASVNLWRNTAAITSIIIGAQGAYTFSTGSTFTLYGIKAA
jgi:hypothetical protein